MAIPKMVELRAFILEKIMLVMILQFVLASVVIGALAESIGQSIIALSLILISIVFYARFKKLTKR